jgi:phosphotransferase system HPr-like phosphotransfer protein
MDDVSKKEKSLHFVVTHPLGMHARVCSRWVKLMQQVSQQNSCRERREAAVYEDALSPASIRYTGEDIPADSLFKLLEARIPCGAQFDLLIRKGVEISADVLEKLAFIISKQSFDTVI